jgi:AraC-like DNA-binding protein
MGSSVRKRWIDDLSAGRVSARFAHNAHGSFGDGWGHRARTLPDFNLLYGVTAGAIRVRAGGIDAVAGPGAAIWVSAGVRHDLVPARGSVGLAAYHARVVLTRDGGGARPPDDCLVTSARGPGANISALFADARGLDAWSGARLRARLVLLFLEAYVDAELPSEGLTAAPEAAVLAVVGAAPPAGRLTTARLAEAARLSPAYFARRFRRSFGLSPREWLVAERMRRSAVMLLDDDAPVGDIANRLGYADLFLFSRQFRRHHGCSPREFRQRAPVD